MGVYARNWTADNRIVPATAPAMVTDNRMLPDVWRFRATARRTLGAPDGWRATLRLGLSHSAIGDESQIDRYDRLNPGADTDRLSVPFGATVRRAFTLGPEHRVSVSAEAASDDPGVEDLYISVDRPGPKPTWIGNPDLRDPKRATLRAELRAPHLRCEVFGARLWDYVYPVARSAGGQAYQTCAGIDALTAGADLSLTWRRVELGATWNWGEKSAGRSPLAEIRPLLLTAAARTPPVGPATGRLSYVHAVRQDRVDAGLNETASGPWDRVDLGVDVATRGWTLLIDAENVLDELYAQHLSYLRNPFASGLRVLEPGRTLRFAARIGY